MKHAMHMAIVLASLLVLSSAAPCRAANIFADDEETVYGTVTSGDYTDTWASDDTYEAIQEETTTGKPSNRVSRLEHKWTFDVSGTSPVFYVEACHTANSEGDDFLFSYSTKQPPCWIHCRGSEFYIL